MGDGKVLPAVFTYPAGPGRVKLSPGPEMAAFIARDVMGWERKWIRAHSSTSFLSGYFDTRAECKAELWAGMVPFAVWVEGDQIAAWEYEWRPWASMDLAWRIVKKIASKKKYEVRLRAYIDGSVSCIVHEDFGYQDTRVTPVWGVAAHVSVDSLDDAALAICFAALKVRENESVL